MLAMTREWVENAEEDWNIAGLALRSRKTPRYRGACFHTQQCVEKYLKARLYEDSLPFPKTHDLTALLDLLVPSYPLWTALRPALLILKVYAVDFRYPGETAGKEEAQEAVKLCRDVRATVRGSFGLPFGTTVSHNT